MYLITAILSRKSIQRKLILSISMTFPGLMLSDAAVKYTSLGKTTSYHQGCQQCMMITLTFGTGCS